MIIGQTRLTPEDLATSLVFCGYRPELLRRDFMLSDRQSSVPLVAFGQLPADSRSACVAVLSSSSLPKVSVEQCRSLGAPVLFLCTENSVQWWKQGAKSPIWLETIPTQNVENFFQSHREEFAPEAVYRAKTWGRFRLEFQKSFVDLGLMPIVEEEVGQELSRLIAQNVSTIKSELNWGSGFTHAQGHWLLKSIFWLISGKILRDKNVPAFQNLNLLDTGDVFSRVATHFGSKSIPAASLAEVEALMIAAESINRFSSLTLTTTESLAFVYENTLISTETRSSLGTHSTPSYLVDYVVGHLADWIENIPPEDRSVFEPACGHASFLCSAMRLLSELLPPTTSTERRERYLRSRLHGTDVDAFALELARLSLTLTDIPNPNGWDLRVEDVFIGDRLSEQAQNNSIFLVNPPFANFKPDERAEYLRKGARLDFVNRATEVLWRAIPNLTAGSVFGLVLPQSFLHNQNSTHMRRYLAENCELKEICLFPDKVFTFSDAETVIILGRKLPEGSRPVNKTRYRRVRESQMKAFQENFTVSRSENVPQQRFIHSIDSDFRVPDLGDVWACMSKVATLSTIANVGQGLIYEGKDLPVDAITFSTTSFPGATEGYIHFGSGLRLHDTPATYWMNLDPAVIRRPVTGTVQGVKQVLLNYAPVSRGPWRLKALVDEIGRPVSSRFITIRPRKKLTTVRSIWAILNSPVANAYAYCHLGKRDNIVGRIRKIPIPNEVALGAIDASAGRYLEAARSEVEGSLLRKLMDDVDAEVLKGYGLSIETENAILEMFRGIRRSGVQFNAQDYVPVGLEDRMTFYDFNHFQKDWGATNSRRGELIDKMILQKLSPQEHDELKTLQTYADYYLDKTTPPDTTVLDALELQVFGRMSR